MTRFEIGKGATIEVDLEKIMAQPNVVQGLVNFAVKQVLTNAHASITAEVEPDAAKRRDQAAAAAEKRLAAWYEGNFTITQRGPRGDAVTKIMRELAEAAIKENGPAYTMWKKLDGKGQRSVVDKMVAANEAAYRKTAEARLAITVEQPAADDIMALFATESEKSDESESTE